MLRSGSEMFTPWTTISKCNVPVSYGPTGRPRGRRGRKTVRDALLAGDRHGGDRRGGPVGGRLPASSRRWWPPGPLELGLGLGPQAAGRCDHRFPDGTCSTVWNTRTGAGALRVPREGDVFMSRPGAGGRILPVRARSPGKKRERSPRDPYAAGKGRPAANF